MCGERDCLNHCVECGDPTCRECIEKHPIALIDDDDDDSEFYNCICKSYNDKLIKLKFISDLKEQLTANLFHPSKIQKHLESGMELETYLN